MRHWPATPSALVFILLQQAAVAGETGPREKYGDIEVLRDRWGVAHVYSGTDAGAMYGLGWSTAEDRGFQMHYKLRTIQGRLAEVIGDVKKARRSETALQNDRKMRTFGFYRAANQLIANLDDESVALLTAYSEGVNDYFTRHGDDLHYLFKRLKLTPEPWTPADCIVSWWHLAQFFATDGTRDLIAYRNATSGGPRNRRGGGARRRPRSERVEKKLPLLGPDDSTAVVREESVSRAWVEEVRKFASAHGLTGEGSGGAGGPKFSHAWAVGGTKTTTGSAVLVSDPQTNVTNPSLFYEFHFSGKTFNARGVGVPGSPVILIGWNRHVAWGMTALGADQADLFRLQTDSSRPDAYFLDGQWHPMETIREQIKIKGAPSRAFEIKTTRFGPVATEFCFARPDEPSVALRRIPVCETDRETIQGAMAMLRAKDVHEFLDALGAWRFPTANVVFADRHGNVGYSVAGAIPVRSARAPQNGRQAHDGTSARFDWQGFVPQRLLPHVVNPERGYVLSANHRPVGAFYPIPLGVSTGSGGDTIRSWRLRERLEAKIKFTPRDVLDIHYDSVNPARRQIVALGLYLRDLPGRDLSEGARAALQHLESWHLAGASVDLDSPGAALAAQINTLFRFSTTDLASKYGGGPSGLAYFLKDVAARTSVTGEVDLDALEQEFIDNALAGAWRRCRQLYGSEIADWDERARKAVEERTLGYYASLDGFGSLDPARDISVPALSCVDGDTIRSQAAQAYSQWVNLGDVDAARSILPVGVSERPGRPSRLSNYEDWKAGKLHPAPLSRQAVEKHVRSRESLAQPPRILADAAERIEHYRKGPVAVRVVDASGRPVRGADVTVRQSGHEFLFGCNIFLHGKVGSPADEQKYRSRFAALFNFATLPFYWSGYEPISTHPQHVDRRRVVEWCREQGISVKGHPLVWNHPAGVPRWLPDDPSEVRSLSEARVADCVERFARKIDIWDVVNEATDPYRFEENAVARAMRETGKIDWTVRSFLAARRANTSALLLINDYRTDKAYADLISKLVDAAGNRIYDAIGIQSHLHGGAWEPRRTWEICDRFARFGVPLHFTETTIVSGRREDRRRWGSTLAELEEIQAREIVRFYTTLFSHPAVEAITWWDFADRRAWQGAPAGLLRKDLSAKPAYDRLLDLVRGRWWTDDTARTGKEGEIRLRAFYGSYEIRAKKGDRHAVVRTEHRRAEGRLEVRLTLPGV